MTENQFKFDRDTVATNLKTPIVYDEKRMSIGEVLDKLNELSDENEQLKQELIEFKKWKKYVGDVKREDLDKVFKMSVYEIADLVLWQEKVKEVLQKYYNVYTQRAIDGKPVSDVTDAIMKIEDELGLELR